MTTQETAKALRCCAEGLTGCLDCPLLGKSKRNCDDMHNNAADLLESFTAELKTTHHQLEQAKQECKTWKLRAEAAVNDMAKCCAVCKYYNKSMCVNPIDCFSVSGRNTQWQWRGPCVENGGTDATD